jgi:hypothetical protein
VYLFNCDGSWSCNIDDLKDPSPVPEELEESMDASDEDLLNGDMSQLSEKELFFFSTGFSESWKISSS